MFNSTNHRKCTVVILLLASLVAALLAGIGWSLLGGEPLAAVAAGGAAFASCFGIGLGAATYLREQGS
ncbi:hypothetical protein [Streptomyces sp. NBC_00572]|uniref:hypothetical protein n=1 Tax=Streptomyces sp. NBC_00572 TaxID=2903664 RepID=UPI00224ECDAC|nr:hypothetical protein [Streptomyces sp. NBC_00572]MCX4987134.1 hypothetical protein [Streptomyces sp. NBC_00572]